MTLSAPVAPPLPASGDAEALSSDLVIRGVTRSGQTFRPSDWSDRLCGVMSVFGADEQLRYSPLVAPALREGLRCVIVRRELAALEPRLFKFFLSFALDNELQISYDADAVATLLPEAARRLSQEVPPAGVDAGKVEDY